MLPDMVTGDTCRSCHHELRSRFLWDGEARINGCCEQNAIRSPETDIDKGTVVGKRRTISSDLPEKSLWNPQKCAMIRVSEKYIGRYGSSVER